MTSRWTDFLTSDGEKPWRNRDIEFEDVLKTKEEVLHHWNTGWHCLFEAIDSITQTTIHTPIYIRNVAHTIPQALNRQLAHYAYHIGQIVYLSKLSQGNAWQSLSIPKNASTSYNKTKFAKPRHTGHYTDDFLGYQFESKIKYFLIKKVNNSPRFVNNYAFIHTKILTDYNYICVNRT
ncbi:DUF1572 family protein [Aquimarina intermedia]|uniref:Uncharacterized protein DUF1572 n=1 Tax=Aquimarina intermedia TaxID=350814 RepID=A0A5S5C1C8_9FLAO|nr:DUF1572 family protein [Aquimarina intermedia]TYP72140.1 uncharacterized protein DUF1572 [Aquimarina intermedia]